MKRICLFVLLISLVACQPQSPVVNPNGTPIIQSIATASITIPTSKLEVEPAFTEGSVPPFVFEQIRMFAENGMDDIETTSGWAVASLPDGNKYLLHTQNGGRTWKRSTLTSGGEYTFSPPIFLSSQVAWNTKLDGTLEQTRDGGQTWTPLLNITTSEFITQSLEVHFWDADHGIMISMTPAAGTAFLTLRRTENSGANWQPLKLTPPWDGALADFGELQLCSLCADKIYIDASRIVIVYGLNADQTLNSEVDFAISLDEGKTWRDGKAIIPSELKNHAARFGAMTFFDDQHAVFSLWSNGKEAPLNFTEFSMLYPFYSSDGGMTWMAGTPTPTSDIINMFVNFEEFLSPADAILRCGSQLCATHNSAQSWDLIQPDIIIPGSSDVGDWLTQIDFITPRMGFAILLRVSGVTDLYRTRDGGVHWTLVTPQITR
jgi:photosystem II stability/assembly factor-like uncharacterized protein